MSWIRITRWKAAAIVLVVLFALFIDGFSYIARVTSDRSAPVVAQPAPTATSFSVPSHLGDAFVTGNAVLVGNQPATIQSISGDRITLTKPLPSAPNAGTSVTQKASFGSLTHSLTAAPSLFGHDLFIHKGLDIQGGTELTIAICKGFDNPPAAGCRNGPQNGVSVSTAQQQTIPVLQQRVNGLGVSEATIKAQGDDQILVELPGVSLQQATQTIGRTAKLHFAVAKAGSPTLANLKADQENLFDVNQLKDTNLYPTGYHWQIDDKIPASSVTKADVATDQNGAPAVAISFDSSGGDEWNTITNAAYAQYQSNTTSPPPAAHIAIFLDTQIISAPIVTGGNQGSNTQITNLPGGLAEAQLLSQEISAGALPAEIGTVASSQVSPTLGADTVHKTLVAGAIGLIVVVLFMIGYYRFPGVLASLALLLYTIINLAVYKLIGVTVSLAGLAGFLLSVGMAVDANVLIFERTRDELRHGRGVGVAVETGFRRAFPAIRDSNVSTGIVCLILYLFGSSVVKGFALTLGVGVLISFFSAILITQSLLTLVLRWRMGRNPRLYTEIHQEYEERPPKGRFDIVRARNLYFMGSLVVIIPGILAILFWHDSVAPSGFRLGLDFAGGNRIEATFVKPANQSQVLAAVNAIKGGLQPQVQDEGNNKFAIQTLPTDSGTLQQVIDGLRSRFQIATAAGREDINTAQVGPSIASSLVIGAVGLVLASSLFIALYLMTRFRGQRAIPAKRFAVCTFLKLLHDVFVLLGIWAILGHFTALGQVDSLFITALLTSVAFSIHDTIVVFDRVRENLRVGPRLTFDQVINLSTVQTMTRSLNTSLTVVFVLVALVLFGGSTVQGFVLALLIGIITGTYSSIFNASTLLVAWQKSMPHETPGRGPRRVAGRAA